MMIAGRSVRRVPCPECGVNRRDIWRHFGRAHPGQTFAPIGWYHGRLWWAVGCA